MTERVDKGSAAQRRTALLATIFVVFVCVSLLVVDVWLALRARTQEIQQATMANTNRNSPMKAVLLKPSEVESM